MRLCSFRIKNYKSFVDSDLLEFSEGFNLIVGQNNVGKTALLEGLGLDFIGKPHRSLITKPTPTAVINLTSRAEVKFTVIAKELREVLLQTNAFYIPIPNGTPTSAQDALKVLQTILSQPQLTFSVLLVARETKVHYLSLTISQHLANSYLERLTMDSTSL